MATQTSTTAMDTAPTTTTSTTTPTSNSLIPTTTTTTETADPTSKPSKPPIAVTKPTPYTFDLGHLLCHDPNPLPSTTEPALLSTVRDAAQALLNQLLTTCPIASTPAGVLLTLPPPTTKLPREKALPAVKAMTKWEQFAKKKGIKDKKRDGNQVYDEETGEWGRKWGYKGLNKNGEGEWLVEVDEKKEREGVENGGRGEGRRERKERVRRGERRERANEKRGAGKKV